MSLPRIASRRARGAARGRERVARVPRTLFRRVRVHGASGIVRLCSAGVPFDALDHRGRRLWIPRSPSKTLDSKVSATLARTARVAPGSSSTVARGCPWIPATNGTPSTSRAAPEHRRGGSARPGRAITNDSAPSSPSPGRPVALPSRRNAGICYRTWPRPRAARQGGRGGPTRRLRFEFQELGLSTIECQEREFR